MTTSTGATFAELLAELRACGLDAGAYASLIAVFRSFDGSRIQISGTEVDRQARRDLAARLLERRTPRALIRDRLMRTFNVCARTAQRDVQAALDDRRPPAPTPRA